MTERILSVFIDESDNFRSYDFHAPFCLAAMVLHNQEYYCIYVDNILFTMW